MRVKVCGIRNEEELVTAIRCGADVLGFQVGQQYPSHSFILPSTAGRLAASMPPYVNACLVTHMEEPEDILDIMDRSGIRTVQVTELPVEKIAALRDKLEPAARIILSVYLRPGRYEWHFEEYLSLVNGVLVDAYNLRPELMGVDSPDKKYRWDKAAELAAVSPLPVILAGALTGENVNEAIAGVQPFGIDVFHGVRDKAGNLQMDALLKLIRAVRQSELELLSGQI